MQSKDVLYAYAMSFSGLPYRWGGDDTIDGFDCSGLCIELLQSVGVFPHGQDTTAEGLRNFYPKAARPDFGTLVFYGPSTATHVGFCLNDHLMLEAGGGGSKTKSRADAANQNAYVRIRPIRTRKDLIGFASPTYAWNEGAKR